MKRVTKPLVIGILLVGRAPESACGPITQSRDSDQPKVTTALVTRGAVRDMVAATGTLQAVTTVQVGTQVSGTVSWLGADFNSIVHKGQVIARLDPSLFQTQVEQAQRQPDQGVSRRRQRAGEGRRRAAEIRSRDRSWPQGS